MKNLVERLDRSMNWQALPELAHWVINQALMIQQIPAPTFHEQRRAEHVKHQFLQLGLYDVDLDEMANVYGRLPGKQADTTGSAVMIVAHTDTVFPEETDLKPRVGEGIIYGPGLGDNSMGVAGMLGFIEMLRRERITPDADLWFVATTREEGLGDLGGMRTAFERLQHKIRYVINIEGLAFGHIYHAGIAVRRLKITAKTEGGHSWLHFGRPSAIHALMRLGVRIDNITPPTTPRTTYNIGVIEGGQSVNSIASTASMWLDMRSEQRESLEWLEREVRSQIAALKSEDISFETELVGDRPAGIIEPDHPLVRGAMTALSIVGSRGSLETGSTDGNISLAANCPTVTIGITRGGNAHRLDEFIETAPVQSGMQQLILLTLAAAAYTLN